MAPGPTFPSATNGASKIQKNIAASSRLIVAAVAAAAAVGTATVLTTSGFAFPEGTIGAWLAVLLLVVGLLQGSGLVFPLGVVVLAGVALLDIFYGTATIQAPLIGGALLATAEFGYWSFEFEAGIGQTPPVILRRVAVILGLVVLGTGLSAMFATLGPM